MKQFYLNACFTFLVAWLFYNQAYCQSSATKPDNTTVVYTPNNPNAGDLGKSTGKNFAYSNANWPAYVDSCFLFGYNDTLFNVINGYNTAPPNGACSGMSDLVYDAGQSNLNNGVVVYTGATNYRYQNTGYAMQTASVPIRLTMTFSDTVMYFGGNFYLPVKENFDVQVLIEGYSPGNAIYFNPGTPNTWTPAVDLFDYLHTDLNSSICTSFDFENFFVSKVSVMASNNGPVVINNDLHLAAIATGDTLSYAWTGPNTFTSANAIDTITAATQVNEGMYYITVVDTFGCPSYDSTLVSILTTEAICKDIQVLLDSTGNATIDTSDVDNGSYSASGPLFLSLDTSSFDCNDIGANTVKLFASDTSGYVDSCLATVTVLDQFKPRVITTDTTVYLNTSGEILIDSSFVNLHSWDNCGIQSMALDTGYFTCNDVDINFRVILSVEDVNGNSDTAGAFVLVKDTLAPSASSKNINVYVDSLGIVVITPDSVENGSTDNCSITNKQLSKTSFSCSDITNNPILVTYTVFDQSNNADSVVTQINVLDTLDPYVKVKNFTTYLDSTGNVTVHLDSVDNGTFDNCELQSTSLSKTNFSCSDISTNPNVVTFYASDIYGNMDSITANITVLDTIKPVVLTNDTTLYVDGAGNASIVANDINNGSWDNCGIAGMQASQTNFTCNHIGLNTVYLIVTDNNGLIDSAAANVTVLDTIKPTLLVQNVNLYLDSSGVATLSPDSINNGTFDNCGLDTISVSRTDFGCDDISDNPNQVFFIAEDVNGNKDSVLVSVMVLDTISAMVIGKDVTLYLDSLGSAMLLVNSVDNGSYDNCGFDNQSLSKTTFGCADIANNPNQVYYAITDMYGNKDSVAVDITVLDSLKPNVLTNDTTLYLDGAGNASIVANDINNGSWDNCGVAGMQASQTNFTCNHVGLNTVYLIVTDNNGLIDSAAANVTVLDTIKPTLLVQNVNLYLDSSGVATLSPDSINNGTFDNCGLDTISVSRTDFGCDDISDNPNQVFFIAEDVNGNKDSVLVSVMVLDTISAMVIGKDVTLYLDSLGSAMLLIDSVDNGSYDNCGFDNQSLSKTTFGCADIANNPNQVYYAITDMYGNKDSVAVDITVLDTLAPYITTQNVTIYLDSFGVANTTANDIDNGSFDNCNVQNMSLDTSSFTCDDLFEQNMVTLYVEDSYGNIDSATAEVIVLDTIHPIAKAQGITVYLNQNGMVSIQADTLNNNSTDNCAVDSVFVSQTMFSCNEIGSNNVFFIVKDKSGNLDSVSTTVEVLDTIVPIVNTRNVTAYVDNNGSYKLPIDSVNNASFDNCLINNMYLSDSLFDCSHVSIAPSTYWLIASDASGNIDSSSFELTILDTIKPIINAFSTDIYLDENGNVSITTNDLDNGTTDNCAIDSLHISKSSFTCADIGDNELTFSAVDVHGNVRQEMVIVTVVDTFTTANATVENNNACEGDSIFLKSDEQAQYSWSGPSGFNSNDRNPVLANVSKANEGTYYLTIINAFGCEATDSVLVSVRLKPQVVLDSIVDVSCNGGMDGAIYVTIQNGATPSFNWNTGQQTEDLTNIGVGDYQLTVENENGCGTVSEEYMVQEPVLLSLTLSKEDVSCFGENDGSMHASPEGGNGNYTYTWFKQGNAIGNHSSIENLSPDYYTVSVMDAKNCNISAGDTIHEPALLEVNLNSPADANGNEVSEFGGDDGQITADITGGTAPYDVLWSTGDTSLNISNLRIGEYSILVTDTNGCSATNDITLSEPLTIIPSSGLSPNGDGRNDNFVIQGATHLENSRLYIMDKHGAEVYKVVNYKNDWNGINMNGKELPGGTYYYMFEYNNGTERMSGYITLKRN